MRRYCSCNLLTSATSYKKDSDPSHIHNCTKIKEAVMRVQKTASLVYCYDCMKWYVLYKLAECFTLYKAQRQVARGDHIDIEDLRHQG